MKEERRKECEARILYPAKLTSPSTRRTSCYLGVTTQNIVHMSSSSGDNQRTRPKQQSRHGHGVGGEY